MKTKCSTCNASSKQTAPYKGKLLCPDCSFEYRAILEGSLSNKFRRRIQSSDEKKPLKDSYRVVLEPPSSPIVGFWQTYKKPKELDDNPTI